MALEIFRREGLHDRIQYALLAVEKPSFENRSRGGMFHLAWHTARNGRSNPFRTAVPFWGQTTQLPGKLSPNGTVVLRVDLNEDYFLVFLSVFSRKFGISRNTEFSGK